MSQRIPQNFIEEVLARSDIVELIDNRVSLKKAGSNYSACCPFHNEKTPSFTVSPPKQFYYCFGCGAHGNAISFLMQYDKMEFIDAVEHLANRVGLEVPRENIENRSSEMGLYELLEKARNYYQAQLEKTPAALNYLEQRGISKDMINQFKIGFAPSGWDHLHNHLAKNSSIQQQLIQAGMLIKTGKNKIYDRFRNRIMFPIHDTRGRVIAFGGRTITDEQPKYLNSPETPIFHKSTELYGLYEARQAHQNLEKIIIVEGYLDVISLVQYKIDYAVATLGTATSQKHLQRLLRYTQDIIFCFDGDRAGFNAAWRALEIALPLMNDGIQIRFMFLPQDQDPDTFIRAQGTTAFEQKIEASPSLADFFFNHLSQQVNLATLDGKARLAKLALERLNKLPPGIFQQLMVQRLNTLIGTQADQLLTSHREEINSEIVQRSTPKKLLPPVSLAIGLLLQNPYLAHNIELPSYFNTVLLPGLRTLIKIHAQIKSQKNMTTGALLESWRENKKIKELAKLAAWDLLIPQEGLLAELTGAVQKIEELCQEKMIQELMNKANQQALSNDEKQELMQLLNKRQRATS